MLSFISLALALAGAESALAHGGVLSYKIGSTWYKGVTPYNSLDGVVSIQRPWYTFNPIENAASTTIACNNDGESLAGSNQLTATIAAGQSITAYWNEWPHPQGPQITYLAQCPGSTCTGVDSRTLKWFKIDEAGLLSGTVGKGFWAAEKMIQQNNSWTSTIPSTVPSGHYLIRFETIALHGIPAQVYPECAQIQITGGGSLAPTAAQLVTFPGAYKNSEIDTNLYSGEAQTSTYYKIPGPPLYGSGSSNPGSTTVVPTTAVPSTTTRPPSTTTTRSSTAVPSSTGTAGQFAQCGGIGYTGPTVCVSPYTCKKQNDYYSQCL